MFGTEQRYAIGFAPGVRVSMTNLGFVLVRRMYTRESG
jgi:hypothetical protein